MGNSQPQTASIKQQVMIDKSIGCPAASYNPTRFSIIRQKAERIFESTEAIDVLHFGKFLS